MFQKILSIILLAITTLSYTATAQVEYGTFENGVYQYQPLRLEIRVPEGAELINTERQKAISKMGNDAIEESTGMDMTEAEKNLKNLLAYTFDNKHTFMAVVEPFIATEVRFEKNIDNIAELLRQTFENEGFIVDMAISKREIKSRPFMVLNVKIYADEEKDYLMLKQDYYATQVSDKKEMLSVVITYTEEEKRAAMYRSFENAINNLK